MLPIEIFEKMLNGNKINKTQLSKIRDLLYQLATIEFQEYKIKENGNKRSIIHQGIN